MLHIHAGCKRGIKTGQYKGGNGPTRVKMEERSIKEAFERIKNTPLTSKDSHVFVSDVLTKIGLKENLNEDNLIEENLTEGNLPVNEPVMQKPTSTWPTKLGPELRLGSTHPNFTMLHTKHLTRLLNES